MNKIFMLAKGNIRKAKGQMIILAALFMIAATLLIMGLSVMTGFGSHFDELVEELNTSEAQFVMAERLFTPRVEALFSQHATEFETHTNIAFSGTGDLTWEDDVRGGMGVFFYSIDDARNLSQWKLVGEYLPLTHDSVYVPYMLHFSAGYNLGDVISFTFEDFAISFTVAGFVENIWTEAFMSPRMFIPGTRFDEIYNDLPGGIVATMATTVYVNGLENVQEFSILLTRESGLAEVGLNPYYWMSFHILGGVISGRTGTAFMMSTLMVAFTIIIGLVSVLVMRFRIKNAVEEDMPKIGSLMSIGYTSRQITASVVAQYASIVFVSVVIGIVPAVLLLPVVGRIFGELSGIYWQPGFMPVPAAIAVVGLTALVLLFTRLSARNIKKISPVLALRGGVKTHSFKRNPLPLEKSIFSVNISLALKSVLQGFRQSTMMFVILLAVSFTAVVSLVIFYNAAVDLTAFEQIPGIERYNAGIAFTTSEEENIAFQAQVDAHPDVRDSQFLDERLTTISGVFSMLIVMEDFDRRVTRNVYEGIFPRYENEAAITGLLAQRLEVGIGDLVYIGDYDMPFLVTGLLSGFEMGQYGAYITFDGANSLFDNVTRMLLAIYLNPGVDAAVFVEEMEGRFQDYILITVDMDEAFAHGVAGFAGIMSTVGVIVLVISTFVIILVLYFVISSTIVRKYRDLGIQKAIGYTTVNLMNQISLSFFFPVTLGAVVGAVLGALMVNPLMTMGMRPMGVMQSNLIIDTTWAVVAGVITVLLSYVISMLVTWRIRKISAYRLVTE